jgi:hypothetical protein
MTIIKGILDNIKINNLLFLAIIVVLFQIISILFKPYSINLYQPASLMSIYVFINTPYSMYQLIMGGLVATICSFIIYKIFILITPKINRFIFNLITFLVVVISMTLLNCVSLPAIAYTLMADKSISENQVNFLCSYIISTIIIIILCSSVLFIVKNTNQIIFKSSVSNLHQLENNFKN